MLSWNLAIKIIRYQVVIQSCIKALNVLELLVRIDIEKDI